MRILPSMSLSAAIFNCIVIISIQHVVGQSWFSVRLVGGSYSSEGRVEVYANGAWGTVCDDGWGINDATVVCRQLGYTYALSAEQSAYFGQGSGAIVMDNVACTGLETKLAQCPYTTSHNCGHSEDAGVVCSNSYPGTEYDVRLVDGTSYLEGRVEVYADGAWGTVCDNGWGIIDATVVCRQLGSSGAQSAKSSAHFGQGSGEIVLNHVSCTGSESNIGWCPSDSVINCVHSEDAGVICIEDNDDPYYYGLSGAAIAGIVVGGIFGVVVLVAVVCACCSQKTTTQARGNSVQAQNQSVTVHERSGVTDSQSVYYSPSQPVVTVNPTPQGATPPPSYDDVVAMPYNYPRVQPNDILTGAPPYPQGADVYYPPPRQGTAQPYGAVPQHYLTPSQAAAPYPPPPGDTTTSLYPAPNETPYPLPVETPERL
ncbi:scavenger receptor cysteine-rich domain-containing group B protein-like [Asterias amurensis]|uniref:scavenger receptor cysteine-rich domain-containing group B protein-like n=1 Tax=Asterias amurensis TaxID=7602 RepID=UPI003AB3851C